LRGPSRLPKRAVPNERLPVIRPSGER
jgi:hypothetical protein